MSAFPQLTERQQAVYDLIRSLIIDRGYGPTVREIGEAFGIKSPNGVMCHLKALERKGLITRSPNKSRAIELTQPADRSGKALQFAGQIAAGPTTLAFEQNDRVDFSDLLYGDDRFVLRVSGDSMIDAHICDGDTVILEFREPKKGDVVAALIDGETTLKRYVMKNRKAYLKAENPDYPDLIPARELVIQGVMIGLLRNRAA